MEKYQNILVVIDPTTEEQKALKRAVELAVCTNAKITAYLCIYDFSYEMTTMLSADERDAMMKSVINDRQLWLSSLIEDVSHDNVQIDSNVIWHNRPFEPIIEQVIKSGYDIVIKGTHQHDALKSIIFTPTDWHLLRKSPCPVLLVKEHQWRCVFT